MKKIFNILLLLLVVISLSGIATGNTVSATYISDSGHKSTYHQNYVDYYKWYLVNYTSNHCTFVINDYYKYGSRATIKYTYTVDYRTYNYNYNLKTTKYYRNGHYLKGNSKYVYTHKTPYAHFKYEKYSLLRSVVV